MSKLKIIPLGGNTGVTKNMYVYEHGDQILLVDCGIGFPPLSMLGIDVLIPDIGYLKGKEHMIVGMLLTHAHDDHIAALPYILPELPESMPIYGSRLTIGFAKDRIREYHINANFQVFPDEAGLNLGDFYIQSIRVTHSVPDTRHYAIGTPQGVVYHGSDYKFDVSPVDGVVSDLDKIESIGREGVLCLLSDSLRSENPHHSVSETTLRQAFEREIQGVEGKFIVTSMSSNLHRIQQAVDVAVSHGRKIVFIGRSVEQNIKTAIKLGFFHLDNDLIVPKKRADNLPDHKLCVIIAGSQGQPESSLARAAQGDHPLIKINPQDKVVFSSDPIPGNEDNVYAAIDDLFRLGANVSYSDLNDDLHVSGHASAPEIQQLMELVQPRYMLPIGGTYRHMVRYQQLASEKGFASEQVFLLDDGQTLEFEDGQGRFGSEIKLREIMVDGTGVGDIGTVVMSDRRALADSGMVVLIVPISQTDHQLAGEIQVVSRGFVFMKHSGQLVDDIKTEVLNTLSARTELLTDWAQLKSVIEKDISNYLYSRTEREPIVVASVVEV